MHGLQARARANFPDLSLFSNSSRLCHLAGILCTIVFSSKPICICIANIHFHFGFMCLPSLLIGFGSFPNVQSVPRNNYIPEESSMNSVADFDGFPARRRWFISSGMKQTRRQNITLVSERPADESVDKLRDY